MSTKFVILGESGSCSDYRAWPLAVAESKERADACLAFINQQLLDFKVDATAIRKEEESNEDARPFLNIPEAPNYPYPHTRGYKWGSEEHKADEKRYNEELKVWARLQKEAQDNSPEWQAWSARLTATSKKRKALEQKYQKLLFNDTVDILYLYDVDLRIVEISDVETYMSKGFHTDAPTPQCECH